MHLLSTAFDVRLLGSLADVRVSQEFRNTSATTVTLARHLPSVDEHTDALRIHRKGRIVDLLQLGSGCGGDEESDDEDLQADVAGHVQLAVDESIADALQLAPGETASIELIATQSLSPSRARRIGSHCRRLRASNRRRCWSIRPICGFLWSCRIVRRAVLHV